MGGIVFLSKNFFCNAWPFQKIGCVFILLSFCSFVLCAGEPKGDSILKATSNFKIATTAKDTNAILRLNNYSTRYRKAGKIDTAFLLAERALHIAKILSNYADPKVKLSAKKGISASYNNLGNIETDHVNYPVAINYFLEALKIREELHDEPGIAIVCNNIATTHSDIGENQKAIEYYERAYAINKKLRIFINMSKNLNNIGQVYLYMKNFDKARECFTDAMKIKMDMKDSAGIANAYGNFGNICDKTGKKEEAVSWFKKALDIARTQNYPEGLLVATANYGFSLCEIGKYKEAQPYVIQARQLSKEIQSPEIYKICLLAQVRIDSAAGHYKEAFFGHLQYLRLRDSLEDKENQQSVLKLQMQYDYDKKETEQKIQQDKKDQQAKEDMQQQKNFRNILLVGLLALVVVAIFIYKNNRDKKKANVELRLKNHIIEEKQKEILDSIRYARRIQRALITSEKYIHKALREIKRNAGA